MKKSNIVFAVLMPLFMSFFMSLAITLINLGPGPSFLWAWMKGFLIGFLVGLPVSFLILPLVRKMAARLAGD